MDKYVSTNKLKAKVISGEPVLFSEATQHEIFFLLELEPSEDVEPVVHAHWILDPNGMDFGLPAWKCSNCGGRNDMIPPFIATNRGGFVPKNPNVFAGSNYCPNCGAKMDEETEK